MSPEKRESAARAATLAKSFNIEDVKSSKREGDFPMFVISEWLLSRDC